MTLTRPAYQVTVGSYSKGWEYTVTAGELVDELNPLDPDYAPVQLVDGLRLTWGYDPQQYIGQLVPATCSFALVAPSYELPLVDPGDHVWIHLDRPGPGVDELIPYVHLDGVLADDPVVTPTGDEARGVMLSMIATDLVVSIAEVLIDDPNPWPIEGIVFDRLPRIATIGGFNIALHPLYNLATALGVVTVSNRAALGLVGDVLGSLYQGGQQLVLRAVREPYTDLPDAGDMYVGDETSPVTFLLDRLGVEARMQTPYQLTTIGGVYDIAGTYTSKERRAGNLSELDGGVIIDACDLERDPTSWRKSRADATNQVKLVGLDAAGNEASIVDGYPDLIKTHGANTRVVQTQAYVTDPALNTDEAFGVYLPDRTAAVPSWSIDSFVLRTKHMSDAELDDYAPRFYPHVQGRDLTTAGLLQIPLAILGIAPGYTPVDPGGSSGYGHGDPVDVQGTLIGATFTISKGELTIAGAVRNEVLRPAVDVESSVVDGALTYAELAGSPTYASTAYRAGGATRRIDPRITYRDMTLIGL